MSLYKIKDNKLTAVLPLKFESYFEKEKKLQNFTEQNLKEIFGLEFISSEFNIESFWIDSLAFDPHTKSFIIIEYKKVGNFSLMDQGQTYLNLVLDHKDSVILEYIEKSGKRLKRNEVDWSQTRVIFIGPKFNNFQKRALSPNLPFELWEVAIYKDNLIEYDQINPISYDRKIGKKQPSALTGTAAREINVYTIDDLVKPSWDKTKSLLQRFEELLFNTGIDTRVKYNKNYIAYISKHGRNYVEVEPQQQGLKIYYRFPIHNVTNSNLEFEDCSKVGRHPSGITRILITDQSQVDEAVAFSSMSFYYLHSDIYGKNIKNIE